MNRNLSNHAIARIGLGCLASLLLAAPDVSAVEPEVRLSFKFILNGSGNRPATGNINTDAEINAQVARANQILSSYVSELRLEATEILEVEGQSGFYLFDAEAADRDVIRLAATSNPGTFHWRNNAINVYITGSSDTAISKFPPNNDIIILCQGIFDTTLAHEVGHSLNLIHTHDGDSCSDTLQDDPDWDRNDIAQNAYGKNYNQLNASQKARVDNTWGNLMSYHDPDNRSVLTSCQMDRMSARAYSDRTWLLNRIPTYVRAGAPQVPFFDMGSWAFPYPSIQAALNAGEVKNRVLVMMQGTHPDPSSNINVSTRMVTRRGTSAIRELKPPYRLPYNVEASNNRTVRTAVQRAQLAFKEGNEKSALAALQEAAQAASGPEKDALELEIGQRLEAMKRYTDAATIYSKVGARTDQPALRTKVLRKVESLERRETQRLRNPTPDEARDVEADR